MYHTAVMSHSSVLSVFNGFFFLDLQKNKYFCHRYRIVRSLYSKKHNALALLSY